MVWGFCRFCCFENVSTAPEKSMHDYAVCLSDCDIKIIRRNKTKRNIGADMATDIWMILHPR